mmetsp:Transcript_32589/g.49839  ORF Transcript_32589/g.49839 Transcript_32589/m.49839 type:complete len:113 (+) Transcript_32589:620-958(+)
MHVTAYAPIGAGGYPGKREDCQNLNAFEDPTIVELSKKYEKSPAQIILNWHLHRGIIVIPKTTKVARLEENFNVYNLKMTDEEYESISKLDKNARFFDTAFNPVYNNIPFFY